MPDTTERAGDRRILIAYYSRAGENYYYGGRRTLEVGNTEVLAGMIRRLLACDVYRIEAADPYSDDYDATSSATFASRTTTLDRASRTRGRPSVTTTPSWSAAQSGTTERQ
jgi:hypothetical protein